MTIQINGTSGISGVDGSATTPALQGSDTDTGISFGSDEVVINTDGTTAVTVDASQRVGIGTASPQAPLTVGANSNFGAVVKISRTDASFDSGVLALGDGNSGNTNVGIWRGDANSVSSPGNYLNLGGYAGIVFAAGNNAIGSQTERMRITSSGEIWMGTTTLIRYNNITTSLWGYDPAGTGTMVFVNRGTAGDGVYQGVGLGKAATSWGTYSDERGKTNLAPIENGLSKVSGLRAVTGRYLEDEQSVSRSFLIAQDVQAVLPEAVDDDNPDKLTLRYTEVIPLLVAALKESKERIETLETQNASFEARLSALEGGN